MLQNPPNMTLVPAGVLILFAFAVGSPSHAQPSLVTPLVTPMRSVILETKAQWDSLVTDPKHSDLTGGLSGDAPVHAWREETDPRISERIGGVFSPWNLGFTSDVQIEAQIPAPSLLVIQADSLWQSLQYFLCSATSYCRRRTSSTPFFTVYFGGHRFQIPLDRDQIPQGPQLPSVQQIQESVISWYFPDAYTQMEKVPFLFPNLSAKSGHAIWTHQVVPSLIKILVYLVQEKSVNYGSTFQTAWITSSQTSSPLAIKLGTSAYLKERVLELERLRDWLTKVALQPHHSSPVHQSQLQFAKSMIFLSAAGLIQDTPGESRARLWQVLFRGFLKSRLSRFQSKEKKPLLAFSKFMTEWNNVAQLASRILFELSYRGHLSSKKVLPKAGAFLGQFYFAMEGLSQATQREIAAQLGRNPSETNLTREVGSRLADQSNQMIVLSELLRSEVSLGPKHLQNFAEILGPDFDSFISNLRGSLPQARLLHMAETWNSQHAEIEIKRLFRSQLLFALTGTDQDFLKYKGFNINQANLRTSTVLWMRRCDSLLPQIREAYKNEIVSKNLSSTSVERLELGYRLIDRLFPVEKKDLWLQFPEPLAAPPTEEGLNASDTSPDPEAKTDEWQSDSEESSRTPEPPAQAKKPSRHRGRRSASKVVDPSLFFSGKDLETAEAFLAKSLLDFRANAHSHKESQIMIDAITLVARFEAHRNTSKETPVPASDQELADEITARIEMILTQQSEALERINSQWAQLQENHQRWINRPAERDLPELHHFLRWTKHQGMLATKMEHKIFSEQVVSILEQSSFARSNSAQQYLRSARQAQEHRKESMAQNQVFAWMEDGVIQISQDFAAFSRLATIAREKPYLLPETEGERMEIQSRIESSTHGLSERHFARIYEKLALNLSRQMGNFKKEQKVFTEIADLATLIQKQGCRQLHASEDQAIRYSHFFGGDISILGSPNRFAPKGEDRIDSQAEEFFKLQCYHPHFIMYLGRKALGQTWIKPMTLLYRDGVPLGLFDPERPVRRDLGLDFQTELGVLKVYDSYNRETQNVLRELHKELRTQLRIQGRSKEIDSYVSRFFYVPGSLDRPHMQMGWLRMRHGSAWIGASLKYRSSHLLGRPQKLFGLYTQDDYRLDLLHRQYRDAFSRIKDTTVLSKPDEKKAAFAEVNRLLIDYYIEGVHTPGRNPIKLFRLSSTPEVIKSDLDELIYSPLISLYLLPFKAQLLALKDGDGKALLNNPKIASLSVIQAAIDSGVDALLPFQKLIRHQEKWSGSQYFDRAIEYSVFFPNEGKSAPNAAAAEGPDFTFRREYLPWTEFDQLKN